MENGVHLEIGQNVMKIVTCTNTGNASIQIKHLEGKIVQDLTTGLNFVPLINVRVSNIKMTNKNINELYLEQFQKKIVTLWWTILVMTLLSINSVEK